MRGSAPVAPTSSVGSVGSVGSCGNARACRVGRLPWRDSGLASTSTLVIQGAVSWGGRDVRQRQLGESPLRIMLTFFFFVLELQCVKHLCQGR